MLATQDAARFRFVEVPITDLAERYAGSSRLALGRGILPLGDLGQSLTRNVTRCCRGYGTLLTENKPPRAAFGVSILDEERLHARGLDPNAKAPEQTREARRVLFDFHVCQIMPRSRPTQTPGQPANQRFLRRSVTPRV
jgi:hypothetical protein